jgi:hypothetical protein
MECEHNRASGQSVDSFRQSDATRGSPVSCDLASPARDMPGLASASVSVSLALSLSFGVISGSM